MSLYDDADFQRNLAHSAEMSRIRAEGDKQRAQAEAQRHEWEARAARSEAKTARQSAETAKAVAKELEKQLAAKDAQILQGDHTIAAYKRSVRLFGMLLGAPLETCDRIFDQAGREAAQDSPRFRETALCADLAKRASAVAGESPVEAMLEDLAESLTLRDAARQALADPSRSLADIERDLREEHYAVYRRFGMGYTGGMRQGMRHGHGRCLLRNGSAIEGLWADDQVCGVGSIEFADGGVYRGEIVDDKPHGQGSRVYADGGRYEGGWQEGWRQGQGTYTAQDGRCWVATWSKGLLDGQGTFTGPDGDRFEGAWSNGKNHGPGLYIWPDGSRFEGLYQNGLRAQGRKLFAKDSPMDYCEGQFVQNRDNDFERGTLALKDGTVAKGVFQKSFMYGALPFRLREGGIHYPNGAIGSGKFETFLPEGLAGRILSGSWRPAGADFIWDAEKFRAAAGGNVEPDGKAVARFDDGRVFEGEWKPPRKGPGETYVGSGMLSYPNGKRRTAEMVAQRLRIKGFFGRLFG